MGYAHYRLNRTVEVLRLPDGDATWLTAGTQVSITNAPGGAFTLSTAAGLHYRLRPADRDAVSRKQLDDTVHLNF